MNNAEIVKQFTAKRIQRLKETQSESAMRATLARLRRGVGHVPGEQPDLWGEFLLDFPEELMGHGQTVSWAEWAVYTALTLFALHQQGKDIRESPMHVPGISLGAAANRLIENEDDRERVSRRFYPAATSADMTELAQHARGLITLLRSKNIPLDYVMLATDLYYFQKTDSADRVRLRWGEDFCKIRFETDMNSEEKGN